MTDVIVEVTGCAWSSPFGGGPDGGWDALLRGACALREVPSAHRLRSLTAGVDPLEAYPGKDAHARLRTLTRRGLAQAVAHAGLDGVRDRSRWAVVLGTSFGASLDTEHDLGAAVAAACVDVGLPRPMVVSTACSSGVDAICLGSDLVREGVVDVCVAGGVDVLTEAKRLGHSALGTMSAGRPRPFDEDADGTVLSEGHAVVVLESPAHRAARGARSHGRVLGCASTNDGHAMTEPDPSGEHAARAVAQALAMAGRAPADVVMVSSHGTGTRANDVAEVAALTLVFGPGGHRPVLAATKPALGHSLGASGAAEVVITLRALRAAVAPPVLGLRTVRRGLDLPVSAAPSRLDLRHGPGPVAVSLSLGFGGFNTCVVLEAAS